MIVFLITTIDKKVFNRSNSQVPEKETTLIALTQIIHKTQLNTSKHLEKKSNEYFENKRPSTQSLVNNDTFNSNVMEIEN